MLTSLFNKFFLAALCFCLGSLTLCNSALATVAGNFKVNQVWMSLDGGESSSGVVVELINTTGTTQGVDWTANTSRYFYVYKPLGNQALAILLTAKSTNTLVQVYLGGNAENGSLIYKIGVIGIPAP